jgi:putative transposase
LWRVRELAMKRKRLSVERIVAVLKQAQLGLPVADLIRQIGISDHTSFRWKRQYAGAGVGPDAGVQAALR